MNQINADNCDKLQKIRSLFDKQNEACAKFYSSSEQLAVSFNRCKDFQIVQMADCISIYLGNYKLQHGDSYMHSHEKSH